MTDERKAWVISVDMGYGHQRAAFPFQPIAEERILTANNDQIIAPNEHRYWERARGGYEFVSRLRNAPFPLHLLFDVYDRFQRISPFFPFRDLSKPTTTALFLHRKIRGGLCKSLVDYIRLKDLPILTTHFIPALAADYHGLERVFCVVTDTDINRVWVPPKPKESRITYLAPSRHARTRLIQYGVPPERIIQTGFPLPDSLVGGKECPVLRRDLARRIPNLDPKMKFRQKYMPLMAADLGIDNITEESGRPLTLMYLVGGAGAQREIGIQLVEALRGRIERGEVRVFLVAGIRMEVYTFFMQELERLGIASGVDVVFAPDKFGYFEKMDAALHDTDIIWTKPSELTFYTALGLPVITSPPVGAHEVENQRWLQNIGSGFPQEGLEYLDDWLFYVLESGKFAEAAWDGFKNAPWMGTYLIEDAVFGAAPSAPASEPGPNETQL